MSVDRCSRCGRQVDTDFDLDFYGEVPNYTNTAHPVNPKFKEPTEHEGICEQCRDKDAA